MMLSAVICTVVAVTSYKFEKASLFICTLPITVFFVMLLKRSSPKLIFAVFTAVLAALSIQIQYKQIDFAKLYADKSVTCDLTITSAPVNHGSFYSATAATRRSEYIKGGIKLSVLYNGAELESGDIISADFKPKTLGGSEYKSGNYAEGIYLTANLKNIVPTGKKDPLLSTLNKMRKYITGSFFKNLSEDTAATLSALTIGDRSYMSDSFYGMVKSAGVSHVMVVSGMHLAIIMSFVVSSAEKLFYNRYIKAAIIVFTVVIMSALCGFTMSILRAGITYLFFAVSVAIGRDRDSVNILGAALTLILIFSPFAVFSVALQLSLLSTFGVLALAPAATDGILNAFKTENRFLSSLTSAVITPLSATLMTLPVTVYCYGYISTVSVITNLLIDYAVTVSLIFAFISVLLFGLLPQLSRLTFFVAGITAKYINYVIVTMGSQPFAVLKMSKTAVISSVVLIFGVLELTLACKRREDMLKSEMALEKIRNELEEKRKKGGRKQWL